MSLQGLNFGLSGSFLLHRDLDLTHGFVRFLLLFREDLFLFTGLTGELVDCDLCLLQFIETCDQMLGLASTSRRDLTQDCFVTSDEVHVGLWTHSEAVLDRGVEVHSSVQHLICLLAKNVHDWV